MGWGRAVPTLQRMVNLNIKKNNDWNGLKCVAVFHTVHILEYCFELGYLRTQSTWEIQAILFAHSSYVL